MLTVLILGVAAGLAAEPGEVRVTRASYVCTEIQKEHNRLMVQFEPRMGRDRVRIQTRSGDLELDQNRRLQHTYSRSRNGEIVAETLDVPGLPTFRFSEDLIDGQSEGEMEMEAAQADGASIIRFFCARRSIPYEN